MEKGYILLADTPAEKTTAYAGGLVKRSSTTAALKGELLNVIPGAEIQIRSDGKKPHNFRPVKDPAVTLYTELPNVAPLDSRDFLMLEAVESRLARYEAFLEKIDWASNLQPSSSVYVSIPGKAAVSTVRVPALVHYIGEVMGLPGILYGVEIVDKNTRGFGTTDGTFQRRKYFDCKDNCGLFVSLDKISADAEGNVPTAEESNAVTVDPQAEKKSRPYNTRLQARESASGTRVESSIDRFRAEDRVVAYNSNNVLIHGTVRWVGKVTDGKGGSIATVGIETDIALQMRDFNDAIPITVQMFKVRDSRHGKVYLPEVFVIMEGVAANKKDNHKVHGMRKRKEDYLKRDDPATLAKQLPEPTKSLMAAQHVVLKEAEKTKEAKEIQQLQNAVEEGIDVKEQREVLFAMERENEERRRAIARQGMPIPGQEPPPRAPGMIHGGGNLDPTRQPPPNQYIKQQSYPCDGQQSHAYEPVPGTGGTAPPTDHTQQRNLQGQPCNLQASPHPDQYHVPPPHQQHQPQDPQYRLGEDPHRQGLQKPPNFPQQPDPQTQVAPYHDQSQTQGRAPQQSSRPDIPRAQINPPPVAMVPPAREGNAHFCHLRPDQHQETKTRQHTNEDQRDTPPDPLPSPAYSQQKGQFDTHPKSPHTSMQTTLHQIAQQLSKEASEYEQKLQELETSKEQINTEMEALHKINEELEQQVSEFQESISQKEADLKELRDILNQKSKESDQLLEQLSDKTVEAEALQQQLVEQTGALQQQLDDRTQESETFHQQVTEKTLELNCLQQQLDAKTQESTQLQEEVAHKTVETEALQQQLVERTGALQQQLNDRTQESETFHQQVTEKTLEVNHLQQQLDAKIQESTQLQQEVAQSRQDSTQLRNQVEQLRQESAQHQQQIREKDDENQQIQARIDTAIAYLRGSPVTSQVGFDAIELWEVPREELQVSNTMLGTGAWGYVTEGKFRGQKVAVKCLHQGILSQYSINQVRREISIMAQVRHPNLVLLIAAVLDVRTGPMIITELLSTSLRSAYENNRLLEHSKLPVLRDVASALNYLHSHRRPILHRDVSSANILLESMPNDAWKAKLSDFGSANLVRLSTTPGEGAIVYAAPEVRTDVRGPQTPKVDVYSFGVLTCEVITTQFPDPDRFQDMVQQVNHSSPIVHEMITNCTKHHPNERPTMHDILNALDALIS